MTFINHAALAAEIHADNVAAGWWTNIATGESMLATRNRPEILMLIVSELSEASDGWFNDLDDDKLPQYRMFNVELADAAIRIYDVLGADGESYDLNTLVGKPLSKERWAMIGNPHQMLMFIVNRVSNALEGYRKSNKDKYIESLCRALAVIEYTFDQFGYGNGDLHEIIAAKRAFNRNRADHKIENRLKADGKKI